MSGSIELADGWTLTTEHAASSYGVPVLVSPDGNAYGPADFMIDDDIVWTAAQVAARAAERAGLMQHPVVKAFLLERPV